MVTSNTAHTDYGPVTDTYRYLCQPFDFISYSDAFIGLDTSHPLLIDITTFANYLVGGILFFPTSDADNVAWSGLSTIYLIGLDGGGQGLNLVTTISYRRGIPDFVFDGVCIPPIPLNLPPPPITPAIVTAWTLEPDWANGVTERLMWKTDCTHVADRTGTTSAVTQRSTSPDRSGLHSDRNGSSALR